MNIPSQRTRRRGYPVIRVFLVVALFAMGAGFGCDSDDGQQDSNVSNPDGYTEEDTSEEDTGEETDGDPTQPFMHCGLMTEEIGPVSAGDTGNGRGLFGEDPDISPECGDSISESGSAVYRFEVEEPVFFWFEAKGRMGSDLADPVAEIHTGSCDESRTVQDCAQGSRAEALLEPGTTYYLWIHGSKTSENPHFRFEWGAEQPACDPADHPSCTDGSYVVCDDPDVREEFACAGDCADGETCIGDTCANAPTVDLGDGATTLGGDRLAYSGEWSAEGKTGCMGSTIETSGVEMFAKLKGVTSGDTVVFDSSGGGGGGGEGGSSDSNKGESNIAFFVLDGCSASQCLKVGRFDSGNNRVEWSAEAGGPFWVVAEVLGSPDKDNAFEFDVKLK